MAIVLKEIPPLPPGWLRVADHLERWEKLRQEARGEAARLARILIDEHGASKVWLIGSAAGVWVFHDESDIDIIVEGLDDDAFTQAWTKAPVLSRFRIDLRPRDEFTSEMWARLIPPPILLAERKA